MSASDAIIPVGGAGGKDKTRKKSKSTEDADESSSRRGGKRSRFSDESAVAVDLSQFIDLDLIQEQLNAAKVLARKGQKQGEVGKHTSPQIKRSIGFMFDVMFASEDLEAKVNKMIQAHNSDDMEIGLKDWLDLKELVLKVKSLTKDEIRINRMASKSVAGWKTVSHFENDNLFEDESEDEAEKLTKKFKAAEYKAIGDYRRASRGRGRGGRGGRGRGGYGGGYSGGYGGYQREERRDDRRDDRREDRRDRPYYSADRLATMTCYKCNKPGHLKADCNQK